MTPSTAMTCVLVLEDEPFIAMDLGFAFEDVSVRALIAANCAEAQRYLDDERIDAALLDVNLGAGATCEPIAAALEQRGLPFILHTGDLDRVGEFLRRIDAPVISKPACANDVAARLLDLIDRPAA